MKKLIYTAGKYSDATLNLTKKNIQKAKEMSLEIWSLGAGAICPHLNSYLFDYKNQTTATWKDFLDADIKMIDGCDAIYMVNGWKNSKGAITEYEHAKKSHIKVITNKKDLKKFIQKSHKRCAFCNKIRTYYRKSFCSKCFKLVQKLKEQHNEDYFKELNKGFLLVPRL